MLNTVALGMALQAAVVAPTFHEVTVYNQGFGLIKETRTIELRAGRQTVAVEDVAARIEPASVGIRSLTDPTGFDVLEQNYQFDLINPLAILNKSVGKRIRFVRWFDGRQDVITGILLSSPTAIVPGEGGGTSQSYNGMVIKTDDGRIVLNPSGEIQVEAIPEGLISVPTLLWDIEAAKGGTHKVELSYLTQGINWNADYVLTLDGKGMADLRGWVTVNNQSGATFKEAKLKLLAGDVSRVQEGRGMGGGVRMEAMAGKAADSFREESLFEYHLYTLQRPATVRNREIKQLSLLEAMGVKVTKKLIVDPLRGLNMYYPNEGEYGTGNIKPQVRIEFVNSKNNQMGMPLPKGTVKVYQRDASGSVQMLGEDAIDHTPKDETISLVVGHSFDVVASRKRTRFIRRSATSVEESFEIEVRNRKETAETVHVYERHWGDWRVTEKSMEFTKLDSNTMEFLVNMKAGETRKITYTIITRW